MKKEKEVRKRSAAKARKQKQNLLESEDTQDGSSEPKDEDESNGDKSEGDDHDMSDEAYKSEGEDSEDELINEKKVRKASMKLARACTEEDEAKPSKRRVVGKGHDENEIAKVSLGKGKCLICLKTVKDRARNLLIEASTCK